LSKSFKGVSEGFFFPKRELNKPRLGTGDSF